VFMVSKDWVIYTIGVNTEKEGSFISVVELAELLNEENAYGRVSSYTNKFKDLLRFKKEGRRNYVRLSKNGIKYFERIQYIYDPMTDTRI
jgi:hypothetical protein